MSHNTKKNTKNFRALVPLLAFVAIYLITGLSLQYKGVDMAFYQMPAPVAAFIGVIVAFLVLKEPFQNTLKTFLNGCGREDIMIMCMIYLLAGAFSAISSATGGVEAVVNLGLTYIPADYNVAGVFIIAAFLSISTGTSVGSIIALGPIAVSLAESAGLHMPLTIGALIGGAMFGDNLSIISDTTIAATRTQGISMKEKFKANVVIALPAAFFTIMALLYFGAPETPVEPEAYQYSLLPIIPYLFVLLAAISGINVFLVLTGGIILAGIIGLLTGSFGLLGLVTETYNGFTSMTEIFILSLLIGGLAHIASEHGGLQWIIEKVSSKISGRRSAELGIGSLAALTDSATANNTVTILITGEMSKKIADTYHVPPRRTASLLDIYSCVVQGIIPYGAQMLIAASFTAGLVSPAEIIPYVWYNFILLLLTVSSSFFMYQSDLNET